MPASAYLSRSRGLLSAAVMCGLIIASSGRPVAAQSAETHCQTGQSPQFVLGNADMKVVLGDAMGQPVTCEFPDPNGTGDVHQQTTTGLAFWRKTTNTPTFTNGSEHWANAPSGWLYWTGSSIDPVAEAQPWPLNGEGPPVAAAAPPTPPLPATAPPSPPPVPAPRPPTLVPAPPPVVTPGFDPNAYIGMGDRYNCSDFKTQADAQAVLRADPRDPNKLDAPGVGIPGVACENNPAPFDLTPVPRP